MDEGDKVVPSTLEGCSFVCNAAKKIRTLLASYFFYSFIRNLLLLIQTSLMEKIFGTAEGAMVFGIGMGVSMFFQWLFLPFLGILADRFGRRKILIVSLLGVGMDCCGTMLTFNKSTVFFYLLGRIFQGGTGGFFPAGQSYVADVSPEEERPAYYAITFLFGQSPGILGGLIVGSVLASMSDLPYQVIAFGAVLLALVAVLFVIVFVRESLLKVNRKPLEWQKANPCGSIGVLFTTEFICGFVCVTFFIALAMAAFNSVMYYYISERYGGGAIDYAIAMCIFAITGFLACGAAPKLCEKYGERIVCVWGCVVGATGCVVMGLSPVLWLFYIGVFIATIIMVAQPSYLSMLSKNVVPQRQAEIQSGFLGFALLSQMIGIFAVSALFQYSVQTLHFPQLVFLASGAVLVIGIIIMLFLFKKYPTDYIRIRVFEGTDDDLDEREDELLKEDDQE